MSDLYAKRKEHTPRRERDEPLPGSVHRVEFKPRRFKYDGEWFTMNGAFFYNRDGARFWLCNLVYFDSHFSLVAAPRLARRKACAEEKP